MADFVLSASKLKTFSACPKRYYYAYIEKLESDKHPAAVLGSAVHKTIERVYRGEGQPLVLFGEEYLRETAESGISIEPRLYGEGIKMVGSYDFDARVPDQLELEFKLPFPNQAHPMCYIHGFLDQTYPWGFVDLKTNTRKPLRGVLDHDLQFIVYHWAFSVLFDVKPEQAIWHHLRTGEDLRANVGNKYDLAIRIIDRIIAAEVTGIYDKNVGDACIFCPYKAPCLGRTD